MQITVHLAAAVAQEIIEDTACSADARTLMGTTHDLGVELRPMHPGSHDPALRTTFFVEVRDLQQAGRVVARLQALRAVRAAFLKPPPASP